MLSIIIKLVIFSVITIVIFYLALSKSRLIPKPIKVLAQFLMLPLHPYLKYGDTLKGIGGTVAIFCGIGILYWIIGLVFGLIKYFMK